MTVVTDAALECLEETNGDVRQATDALMSRAASDRLLYDALVQPSLRVLCYEAIRTECRRHRLTIWNASKEVSGKSNVEALAKGNAIGLMDFPLPGGKKLRTATRGDVMNAADFYERQSLDMRFKAVWLRLVGQSVPGDKTVAEVLTETRLGELQTEAVRYAA